MSNLLQQIEDVRRLVILKHQAGRHDQSSHTPKAYGKGSATIGGAGDAMFPDDDDINALVNKLQQLDHSTGVDTASGQMIRDPDVKRILDDGKYMDGSQSSLTPMEDEMCHWNAAKLYESGDVDSIVIGYSVNHYTKNWIQHTWGLKDGKVVETTPSNDGNELYYGLELTDNEANTFADWVSGSAAGEGKVRRVAGWG